MNKIIYAEFLKLKRSKIIIISALGVMATPAMLFVETLQMHFKYPSRVFTLSDIYSDGLLYTMLLINMMIYIVLAAYIFSREYSENILKTLLAIPVSRIKLVIAKFIVILFLVLLLTIITWLGIFVLSGFFNIAFGVQSFSILIAIKWLGKYILAHLLIYFTISPFAYIAVKSKGVVLPMIFAAVIIMGNAALSNQDLGSLYPWTASYFLVSNKMTLLKYPIYISITIIIATAIIGYIATAYYVKKEDI